MNYDKGPQLTVRMLKEYLEHILDDTKVRIGIGDENAPAHYLLNYGGELLLQTDCYMQNAAKTNLMTVLSFNTKKRLVMAKIPFDIKFRPQIESGEYKVETNFGSPVEIVCWNRRDDTANKAIVGIIRDGTVEEIAAWNIFGKLCDAAFPQNPAYDLFLVTPEPELTPLEDLLSTYLKGDFEYFSTKKWDEKKWNEVMRIQAAELLTLARKQLQPEIDAMLEDAYKTADEVQYKKGWEDAIDNHRKALCAEYEKGRRDVMHQFGFDSNGYDPVYVLEQIKSKWPMSWEKMVWRDIETSGKVHCKSYDKGYDDGKKEALKELPRWKPSNCPRSNLPSLYLTGDGTALYKDGYEISISGLEKLPKEETNL